MTDKEREKLVFAALLLAFVVIAFCSVWQSHSEGVEVYPANQSENHYIGKCDSDAVKKRAHKWGFMSHQKELDVQMQGQCYKTCEMIASNSAPDAVTCIRECNDQQREQRKDGATGLTNGMNALGTGLAIIRLFK